MAPTLLSRVTTLATTIADAALALGGGIIGGCLLMVPNMQAFGLLVGLGGLLILLRFFFLKLIPTLIKMAIKLTIAVNSTTMVYYLFASGITVFVNAIRAAVDGLMGKTADSWPMPDEPVPVTSHEITAELNLIQTTCVNYASFGELWNAVVRYVLSPHTCPFARAAYPLGEPVYNAVMAVLGWSTYDARPYPGNNCRAQQSGPAWVCVGLGTGFVVLEGLTVVLAAGIFLYTTAKGLRMLVAAYCQAVVFAIVLVFDVLSVLLHTSA